MPDDDSRVLVAFRAPPTSRMVLSGCAAQATGMPLGTHECTVLVDSHERVLAVLNMPPELALEVCDYIALVRRENGITEALDCCKAEDSYFVAKVTTFKEIGK